MTPEKSTREYYQACLNVAAATLAREVDMSREGWRSTISAEAMTELLDAYQKYNTAHEAMVAEAFARHDATQADERARRAAIAVGPIEAAIEATP
jgi:hypothetical protein